MNKQVEKRPWWHIAVAVGLGVLAGVVAAAGAIAVTVAGFALSFDALRSVGRAAHMRHDWAWLLPVSVDGAMAVGTVAAVVLHRLTGKTAWYPWAVVLAGAGISVVCNGLHAMGEAGRPLVLVDKATRFGVSAIPAVMLALSVHLLVVLIDVAARKVEGGTGAGTGGTGAGTGGTGTGTGGTETGTGGTEAERVPVAVPAQGGTEQQPERNAEREPEQAERRPEQGRNSAGAESGTRSEKRNAAGQEGRNGSDDEAERDEARETYRLSVAAGAPLSGAELGRMFDRTDRWGRAQVHAVKTEMVSNPAGEGA